MGDGAYLLTHVVTAEHPCCGHTGYLTDLGPGDSIVITCLDCGAKSKNLHWTEVDKCESKERSKSGS